MNRAENFIQAKLVAHRRHEFGDQITRMFPDDGCPEDFVFAGYSQHFDYPMCYFVGYGPVKIFDA